ncbi:zinc carboxypeptidase [Paramyrothecium foliicola]|nr:zinc carboxypeptidase [Paramyrothecium foliicola]
MKLATCCAWALAGSGSFTQSCLLPGETEESFLNQLPYGRNATHSALKRASRHIDLAIGRGDRFRDGSIAPRGLGVDDRNLESILNPDEVRSALQGLAKAHNDVRLFTAPFTTFQNQSVYGAAVGQNPRVLIQSGIHARERGGPDNVIYFLADLLHARRAGTGVHYANRSYTNDDVVRALSAGVVVLPLVNPDGVAHDQATNSCWRKNRNPLSSRGPRSGKPRGDRDVGIDLNRNYGFLWDYMRHFSPRADLWAVASNDPSSEVFHGTAAFSEPETRNSAWAMAQYPQLSWFLDLHSFGGDVLYSWGDDDSQTVDKRQSFTNRSYDGKRGTLGDDPPDSEYGEYITAADLEAQRLVASRIAGAMSTAGETLYVRMPSVSLYPTSGGSADYAMAGFYSRGQCGANRMHGLTIEFGQETNSLACPFYPNAQEYHASVRQVGAGLMELLLAAAGKLGDAVRFECPRGSSEK